MRRGPSRLDGRRAAGVLAAWAGPGPLRAAARGPGPRGRPPAADRRRARAVSSGAPAVESVEEVELHKEASQSYVTYAMSVIVGRALPDARDGLKPVHRRIIFAMHDLNLTSDKPFRKCARVVGEVLGKYHPHGDVAVYDALVRLAQSFSMRAPLVDGHGNFGSVDNDPPAAMRYTECRLRKFASDVFLHDVGFDTVDMVPTFDASQEEPTVLPARVPNLLVNGSTGIAVGMATKIPPHNLGEVVAGLKALIRDPDVSDAALMEHIPAPDFPTGGTILSRESSLRKVYSEGAGKVVLRGTAHVEEFKRGRGAVRELIVITEIPFQTNKSALVENIADLVNRKVLEGVSDLRDESDRDGMRVVLELKTGANSNVLMNNLFKKTQLQVAYHCNMVAIVDGVPRTLSLRQMLAHFLEFRVETAERRARYELEQATRREHVVAGLLLASRDIETVIGTIRGAESTADANVQLQAALALSKAQAAAVLDMPLRRLNRLERGSLAGEQQELQEKMGSLSKLLGDRASLLKAIEADLDGIAGEFGSERVCRISADSSDLSVKDLIPNTQSIITLSGKGYIKRMATAGFSVQQRGGKGKAGGNFAGNDDTLNQAMQVYAHDALLFFARNGKVFSVGAHEIPETARNRQGMSVPQLVKGLSGAAITTVLPVSSEAEAEEHLIMATRKGTLKRMVANEFSNIQASGRVAIKLAEGDSLDFVQGGGDGDTLLLATATGMVMHTDILADQLRPMGRTARGVKGITMDGDDRVVGMAVVPEELRGSKSGPWLLFVTKEGQGKCVRLSSFTTQRRGGRGRIGLKFNDGDGLAAMHLLASRDAEVMIATSGGLVNKCKATDIPIYERTAKGVRVMTLNDGDTVQSVAVLEADIRSVTASD